MFIKLLIRMKTEIDVILHKVLVLIGSVAFVALFLVCRACGRYFISQCMIYEAATVTD